MEQRQYVGIDLHRRRSVVVHLNPDGERVRVARIDNDPIALLDAVTAGDPDPIVVVEACYGWYWLADLLADHDIEVHLAHPLGNNWGHRRVKNDVADATDLADLLRLGRLAEAWIAPPAVRELRELVRHRIKLVQRRSGLKAQIHSVLAKEGVPVPMTDLFGRDGRALLTACPLGPVYRQRVESLRRLIDDYDREVTATEAALEHRLATDLGYRALQALPGVGPVLGAVFVAEIGDVSRFSSPDQLTCWAGLTPRHRESDTKVRRGPITKQGSRLVRWAAIEAVAKQRAGTFLYRRYRDILERRGNTPGNRKLARTAVARHLVRLVYYGLRDGEIRCLATPA
jgi:transposase